MASPTTHARPPGTEAEPSSIDAAKEQAKDTAQEAAEQARQGLRGQVEERSTQAGEQVRTHAGDIRSVAEQLRGQGKDGPARIAEQAADRAERLGGYLTESDADRILEDIEDYARRNPMVVALGGLALGFAASRFLKASSAERASRPRTTPPERRSALPTPVRVGGPRPGAPSTLAGGVTTPAHDPTDPIPEPGSPITPGIPGTPPTPGRGTA